MPTTPTASAAQASSLASLTTLQTAADNTFIADANAQIATANTLGKYFITLTTTIYCNIVNIQNYFRNLGYNVIYLDMPNPNLNPFNPAELFGAYYFAYWQGSGVPFGVHNPQRIMLTWNPPNPNPYPFP